MDIVRVIKVYIFEGEREWVEKTLILGERDAT